MDGMKQPEKNHLETTQGPVSQASFLCARPEAAMGAESSRLAELEMENRRLNRLVAELVIKNQQLRNTL